jgi:hypothetical protein
MTLNKIVNGEEVRMTPEEEAEFLATLPVVQDDPAPRPTLDQVRSMLAQLGMTADQANAFMVNAAAL